MMNKLTLAGLAFAMAIVISSCKTQEKTDALTLYQELDKDLEINTLSKNEKQQGWILLFDGVTFNGWRGYNMDKFPESWEIVDGTFSMTSRGGGENSQSIITEKKYESFAFSVEFKLTKGANSGIIFQVEEDTKYKYAYETGPEYQVIDHENWPTELEDWQICGANYAMYPPKTRPYKPVGEWNRALLVVDGNHVTQILNGEIVVEYEKYSEEWTKLRNSGKWSDYPDYGKFDEGYIALQNHGTHVSYRNIKIKELE